jgi:hypothetical protein
VYLKNYVKIFNKFLFDRIFFLQNFRYYFLNIPYLMKFVLRLYIYFDIFLIEILYLKTRKKNFFYFLRLFIYYNILIWTILPFYLLSEFYEAILEFLRSNITVLEYIN